MLSVLQPQEASLLVWAMSRFARRYSGNRICFLFLRVLRCFSSPGVPSYTYEFSVRYYPIKDRGFPHSEISGSKLTYSSPKHIGVSPVLHRLLVPRHSPCALSNLTIVQEMINCSFSLRFVLLTKLRVYIVAITRFSFFFIA